jgi:hypothetical protein
MKSKEKGATLLLVMILSTVICVGLGSLASYVAFSSKVESVSECRLKATYAAEYTIEKGIAELAKKLKAERPAVIGLGTATETFNLSHSPSDVFPTSAGYTFDTSLALPVESGKVVEAHGDVSLSTNRYRYLLSAGVKYKPSINSPGAQAYLQQEIIYLMRPIFQYAIFYDGILELFPNADLNVEGRVHTNSDFYHGTEKGDKILKFESYVTSVGKSYRGTAYSKKSVSEKTVEYAFDPRVTEREAPPGSDANTKDLNENNDGLRELIEIPVPVVKEVSDDPIADERMYNRAGLKILINSSSSSIKAPDGNTVASGKFLLLTKQGKSIPETDALHDYLKKKIKILPVIGGKLYDYRQKDILYCTDLDVEALQKALSGATGFFPKSIPNEDKWPATWDKMTVPADLKDKPIDSAIKGQILWNSELYITDVSYTATRLVGIRLINGKNLPDEGLTVSSENPVYIKGDFNTGNKPNTNDSSLPTSPDPIKNYSDSYFQPAAIMADAVTVLSNAWSDSYDSSTAISSRIASNTTVNVALIVGNVPSKKAESTQYSGGAENFIRILENWRDKRLTYYGSMVNLYTSQQATAVFTQPGVYSAPNRNWHYDSNFDTSTKLPKGTPVITQVNRGQWMQLK